MTNEINLGEKVVAEAMHHLMAVADCYFDNTNDLDWEDDKQVLGIATAIYNLAFGMAVHMDDAGIVNPMIPKWVKVFKQRAGEGVALLRLMDEE